MLYIFILESIGTSELLLIGLVALIIFGPRKLPEFARMLGKAKNEFQRTTDEFRQTWEREVDFETIEKQNEPQMNALNSINKKPIGENDFAAKNEIVVPEVKEISQADFQSGILGKEQTILKPEESNLSDKRDWL